ncbi:hypothetical protein HYX58_01715 [Candidatus Dependentiae bacterium]|nr:hypothetical protein [Candidatus Dependentiae bacterium]
MKKNNILVIFLCLFTATINASFLPSEKRQKDELIESCPPGENLESGYEPLKAFSENGVTTITIPKESSIYYLGLKSIIDNSITFKNSQKDHPDFFTSGNKLTFGPLTTNQIDDLLKLVAGDEMSLTNAAYLKQKIERKKFFDVLLTLQTAEYLDIPILLDVAQQEVAKNLQDPSILEDLNNQPSYITKLLSYLSPAMQKEIAKKIASLSSYKGTQSLDEIYLEGYKSPFALNNAGTRLAVTSREGTIYDITKPGLKLDTFTTDATQEILFNPVNDNIICSGIEAGIGIINLETNKINTIASLRAYPLSFDATGKKLILASKMDDDTPAIKILDLETFYFVIQIPGFEKPAVLSPDDNFIALSSKNTITLWDINKNQSIKTISIPESATELIFNQMGNKLAISMPSTLMVIDLASKKTLERKEKTSIMRFSPDNKNLIFASEKDIRSWDLAHDVIETIGELPKNYSVKSANQDFSVIVLAKTTLGLMKVGGMGLNTPKKRPVHGRTYDVLIWKTNRFLLESLSLQELVTFMIAKATGLQRLNKDLVPNYEKLPEQVQNLIEKK